MYFTSNKVVEIWLSIVSKWYVMPYCRCNVVTQQLSFLTLSITLRFWWVHRILYYVHFVLNVYIVFWTDNNAICNDNISSWFIPVTSIASSNIILEKCTYLYFFFILQHTNSVVSYFFFIFTISTLIVVNNFSQTIAMFKSE